MNNRWTFWGTWNESDGVLMESRVQKSEVNPQASEKADTRPEAALRRLRECKHRKQACEAVREIVSNLLGCEEMVLFQVKGRKSALSLIWSFGLEGNDFQLPESFKHSALTGVIAGGTYIHEGCGHDTNGAVAAVLPIQFEGETAGVLVLRKMLPQKTKIDEIDRAVFAILSREAGQGLFGEQPATTQNSKGSDDQVQLSI